VCPPDKGFRDRRPSAPGRVWENARVIMGGMSIDVVPDDASGFAAAASAAGLDFAPQKSGFLIQGDDRPGALAENLKKLADAHINVTAIDAVVAGAGRWAANVWVDPDDVSKAAEVLGLPG